MKILVLRICLKIALFLKCIELNCAKQVKAEQTNFVRISLILRILSSFDLRKLILVGEIKTRIKNTPFDGVFIFDENINE